MGTHPTARPHPSPISPWAPIPPHVPCFDAGYLLTLQPLRGEERGGREPEYGNADGVVYGKQEQQQEQEGGRKGG
jgi:hypothetical protein